MARLAEERISELQKRGVYDVGKFIRKLMDRVNDKETYLDILMEGRFAVIFVRNNFSKIHIEYCKKGQDLKTNWNKSTVYFEVTRKSPNKDDRLFPHPGAGPYWVKPAESEDIIGKIQGEIAPIKAQRNKYYSSMESSTPAWNQVVLEETDKYIKQEICDDPNGYEHVSAILFTPDGFVNSATQKQFYLFENDKA
ncbi:hypothetical protein ACFLU8_01575 [Chloroflexota bacterium]